jgi:phosphoglycolate phosphatase
MGNLLKLVVFDCDGTLVDSQHLIVSAMSSAYAAHGMPAPERETVLSIVGLSLVEAFTHLGGGAADYPVQSLADGYREAFHRLRDAGAAIEPLYPGAAEAIASLAKRHDIALGIATGKSQRGVRLVLGHHGLIDNFVTIKTADDAPSKPNPDMVLHAMREVGASPEHTVVVGDTLFDIKMAQAAGASAIGVSWGYHSRERLREAGAVIIDSFEALEPALDKLWTA